MQNLLDFLYDYAFDKSLFCEVPADGGALQLAWRSAEPLQWEALHVLSGRTEHVPRADLLAFLEERGADLNVLRHELHSVAASHIVVATQLLCAARETFGDDEVEEVLLGHERFTRDLRRALSSLLAPRLRLVR